MTDPKATGPVSLATLERQARYVPPSMAYPSPLVWERATGSRIWDVDGKEYVDFTSGVLVLNVGHSHPKVTQAIAEQAGKCLNCYAASAPAIAEFLEALAGLLPPRLRRIILLTTGSEAIEAGVRIARAATGRHEVIAFSGAFHGRTHMAMSLGGLQSTKRGFGPVAPGVLHAYYPYCYRCLFDKTYPSCQLHCFKDLDHVIETESTGSVAGLVIEPYLGSGGAVAAPPEYLRRLRQFCRERDIVFVFDEVQAGFGRTGTMFAFESVGIEPDVVCLGKGISSGVPMSAVAISEELAQHVREGAFGSTYGGFNPLACAAGLATIEVMKTERVVERGREAAALMMQELLAIKRRHPVVGDVRGMGLSLGMEFVSDPMTRQPAPVLAAAVATEAIARGLAVLSHPGGMYGNVLRLMPPLTIEQSLLKAGLAILDTAIEAVEKASLD